MNSQQTHAAKKQNSIHTALTHNTEKRGSVAKTKQCVVAMSRPLAEIYLQSFQTSTAGAKLDIIRMLSKISAIIVELKIFLTKRESACVCVTRTAPLQSHTCAVSTP